MTSCLCSARLLCLHRRSLLRDSLGRVRSYVPTVSPSRVKLQWNRQYSAGTERQIFDRQLFQDHIQLTPDKKSVPRGKEKEKDAWISLLRKHLRGEISKHDATHSKSEMSPGITKESFIQSVDLAHHLYRARYGLQIDPVVLLASETDSWAEAHVLLDRLLDGAEALRDASFPRAGAIENIASDLQLSLDQLTDKDLSSRPQSSQGSKTVEVATLDALTSSPLLNNYYMLLMAEVWKILGSIVLNAADASPDQSKKAMSCVYRTLARLHHSGLVSERVYMNATPESHQTIFRPPGMHLLSTHIMDVLSDTAWQAHEAEVAAEAAAAGRDSPYLPVKMSIKELGHEVWLELILWCCLEHGHVKEGIWLINQLKERGGWHFQSWKPLLENQGALRNTKIDREVSWYPSDSTKATPEPRKSTDPPLPFHGLGKRTISVEVATAFLDSIINFVYTGKKFGGVRPHALMRHINNLKFAIAPITSNSQLLPTTKDTNWLIIRVIEAGGLVPDADPQRFNTFLSITPYVVPPRNSGNASDEGYLAQLHPSQIYDHTSAFTGLLEFNTRYLSYQRLSQGAMESFARLYTITARGQEQDRDESFPVKRAEETDVLPVKDVNSTSFLPLSAPSNLYFSVVTLAHLFDLITVSRAFAFGEWLLHSDRLGESIVPKSAYGNQALAPSLWRFAAATKNEVLGEAVTAFLNPPISINTFRALLNYRICTHQWDSVISTLRYIRDNRVKSWSHSNIATIAAEIIRLDYRLEEQRALDSTSSTVTEIEANISEAKQVLYRIMVGEFDENQWRKSQKPQFQAQTIIGFTRLFRHISSPSLREIVEMVFESQWIPHKNLPYIPSQAFNPIIAAVVETKGSLAGEGLYRRFCVTAESPDLRRLTEGGISRFDERDHVGYRNGGPHFDAKYSHHLQKKMVFPSPNTVRIIAQGAISEYEALTVKTELQPQPDPDNETQQSDPISLNTNSLPVSTSRPDAVNIDAAQRSESVKALKKTIAFCIERFESFGMDSGSIVREVGQDIYSRYRETESIIKQKKVETQRALLRGDDLGKTAAFRYNRWAEKQEAKKEMRRRFKL
ncbi:hypothetical protein BJX70DRAFT_365898 [Aspergillus crustosus]